MAGPHGRSGWATRLEGIDVVVACVRQDDPHLLRAVLPRGLAYTSIAPPWMPWSALRELDAEARRTGARIIVASGLEPVPVIDDVASLAGTVHGVRARASIRPA
jgi:short subunit dehydrogenase-like uncharacterized protein